MTVPSSRGSRLGALTVVAASALVVPADAVAPSASASAERPSVKTVTRSYGTGVVNQDDPDQRLRINFRGKRGDLVTVSSDPIPGGGSPLACERTELWRVDQGRRITQRVAGLWRLPKDGRFTMTYRQNCARSTPMDSDEDPSYVASVQLAKVLPHSLVPGGPAVNLPLERGYVHAAVLTVPDQRAVRVDGPHEAGPTTYADQWEQLLVPDSMEPRTTHGEPFGSTRCTAVSPVFVQAGHGLLHSPRTADGGTLLFPVKWCDAAVTSHVSSVGDRVWFLNARTATVATAAYAD